MVKTRLEALLQCRESPLALNQKRTFLAGFFENHCVNMLGSALSSTRTTYTVDAQYTLDLFHSTPTCVCFDRLFASRYSCANAIAFFRSFMVHCLPTQTKMPAPPVSRMKASCKWSLCTVLQHEHKCLCVENIDRNITSCDHFCYHLAAGIGNAEVSPNEASS